MVKIMTPGPTMVRENVRVARMLETTNPDLDESFVKFYAQTCKKIAKLVHTRSKAYILGGEGILGLEAAIASLTEPGDKVLVIDNGIYGRFFADFVKIYGGEPVMYTCDYHNPVDTKALEEYLLDNHDYKYATVVHCDTPTGVLNDIETICPLLKQYQILTVVDAVSSMFAHEIKMDSWNIDVLCGGSQKALSAPPGLSIVCVSKDAMHFMEKRKTPIASFYANMLNFKDYYKNKWFPYTMPISDIYGMNEALDNVLEEKDFIERHARIAEATRKSVKALGLSLYLESGFSNTVTVIEVPKGVKADEVLQIMKDKYDVMIAGSLVEFKGKLFRIGHMGENANETLMKTTLFALAKSLKEAGFTK